MLSEIACPHCGATEGQVKAGKNKGNQRYKCMPCQRRYTPVPRPRGYSDELRQQALQLHAQGVGIREVSRQLGVNPQSVSNWVREKQAGSKTTGAVVLLPDPATTPVSEPAEATSSGKRRATISDVAECAGVSIATISNFLNNKGRMSQETRTRIQAAMDQLHFTPSALVRAIRQRQTRILGVLIFTVGGLDENVGGSITIPILAGINRAADAAEYDILLHTGWPHRPQRYPGVKFLDGHIDGLLWVAPDADEPVLERLATAGFPVIALLTRHVPDNIGYVNADNIEAMHTLIAHLTALGHRRIAYVGPAHNSNFLDRRTGYRQALAAAGLSWDTRLEVTLSETRAWAQEAYTPILDNLLRLPAPPTAIVLPDDGPAELMINAIKTRGLRVPEDIAVTGFNDIPDAQRIGNGLTTIHQPFRQMGQVAAERLIALIEGATVEECRLTLPTQLIVRASTTAP